MIINTLNRVANLLHSLACGIMFLLGVALILCQIVPVIAAPIVQTTREVYPIPVAILLFFLIPTSFIRPFRIYIQPVFTLVRTVLYTCLLSLSLVIAFCAAPWDSFFVIFSYFFVLSGFILTVKFEDLYQYYSTYFFVAGLVLAAIFGIVYQGQDSGWRLLREIIIMSASIALCLFIEFKIYNYTYKK